MMPHEREAVPLGQSCQGSSSGLDPRPSPAGEGASHEVFGLARKGLPWVGAFPRSVGLSLQEAAEESEPQPPPCTHSLTPRAPSDAPGLLCGTRVTEGQGPTRAVQGETWAHAGTATSPLTRCAPEADDRCSVHIRGSSLPGPCCLLGQVCARVHSRGVVLCRRWEDSQCCFLETKLTGASGAQSWGFPGKAQGSLTQWGGRGRPGGVRGGGTGWDVCSSSLPTALPGHLLCRLPVPRFAGRRGHSSRHRHASFLLVPETKPVQLCSSRDVLLLREIPRLVGTNQLHPF